MIQATQTKSTRATTAQRQHVQVPAKALATLVAVVRVRGSTGIKPDIEKTMRLMRLTRKNHCVIVDGVKFAGMINKCNRYVAWGGVSHETLGELVAKRGRLPGNKRISGEVVDLAVAAIESGGKPDIKPIFRLHPPRKGWKSTKHPYPRGALGQRDDMDALLKRMM